MSTTTAAPEKSLILVMVTVTELVVAPASKTDPLVPKLTGVCEPEQLPLAYSLNTMPKKSKPPPPPVSARTSKYVP